MALRMAMIRSTGEIKGCTSALKRWNHVLAQPAPLGSAISQPAFSPPFVLPEFDRGTDTIDNGIGFDFSGFYIGGESMELMAVPKKKTSPHKRGIRNGPKALKPVPVIVRCNGLRENTDGENGSTS